MKCYILIDKRTKDPIGPFGHSVRKDYVDLAPAFYTEEDAEAFAGEFCAKEVEIKEVERITTLKENVDEVTQAMELTPYDWLGLVSYFEENRRDKKGKKIQGYTDIGRKRKADELRRLSESCWTYAIDAVLFAMDNHYHGFSDGGQLYFKGDLELYKAKEALTRR